MVACGSCSVRRPHDRRERTLEILPASTDVWPLIAKLFAAGGDPKWCWCQFWRKPGANWTNTTPAANRADLEALVGADPAPGSARTPRRRGGWMDRAGTARGLSQARTLEDHPPAAGRRRLGRQLLRGGQGCAADGRGLRPARGGRCVRPRARGGHRRGLPGPHRRQPGSRRRPSTREPPACSSGRASPSRRRPRRRRRVGRRAWSCAARPESALSEPALDPTLGLPVVPPGPRLA